MLIKREYPIHLEGNLNHFEDHTCLQLTMHYQKHCRTYICNRFTGRLRNMNRPFPQNAVGAEFWDHMAASQL